MLKDICQVSLVLWICVASIEGLPVDEIVRQSKRNELRSYMNESLDPCEDFYEFACANYPNVRPIDETITRLGIAELMDIEFKRKAVTLLVLDDVADTMAVTKAKEFYRSCMLLPEMYEAYKDKLKSIIEDFGQMPALVGDSWQEWNFDWLTAVAEINHKYGIALIVDPLLHNDFTDNTVRIMIINMGAVELDTKAKYMSPEFESNRRDYKEQVAAYLNYMLDVDKDVAIKTADEIVDFETALARGMHESGLEIYELFNLTTLEQMQATYGSTLDIRKLVKTVWGSIPPFKFYEKRAYLQNLVRVMQETPKKVVANYVFYKLVAKFFLHISDVEKDQQEHCLEHTTNYFLPVVDAMVYRKYNTQQTEDDVRDIWRILKTAFEDTLVSARLGWMQNQVRQSAVQKLHAMKFEIAPLQSFDEYDRLPVVKGDFLENMKLFFMHGQRESLGELYTVPEMPTPTQRATLAYILEKNGVATPGNVLQPYLLLSSGIPNALNFAKIGFFIAHEIAHGFDDSGRQYDAAGDLRDWWNADSTNAFNERKQCFIDQYSRYIYAERPLPKTSNQMENIADNAGIRLAYQAYLKWYQDRSRTWDELALETFAQLRFTNRQLFFIGYAQIWCENTNPDLEVRRYIVETDEHTPAKYRVIGPLSNLKEFSDEFNCPLGSGMNPINKCEIY